ncbi:hypothetical protein LGM39_32580 [Burkholderia cepacia]|uniref:hypothetical protein n=2 Tax=Burkholderia cepacia TaxID=292 RepID=UPI001CF2F4B4|nr:hypothetical protein [Burkholderia cepacia]MCA7904108.1 hypothetical protein [Burkholderia cepacia]
MKRALRGPFRPMLFNSMEVDPMPTHHAGAMPPDLATLAVFDVAEFPFVVVRNDAIASAGYAQRWLDDMHALMRYGEPFVMIFPPARPDEAHDDRKERGMWLKQNRAALAAVCRALITIEPDPAEREAAIANASGIEKAFGIPFDVTASLDDARQAGRRRLAEAV